MPRVPADTPVIPAHSRCCGKAGFTILELSIVLVIIGLIVGGVLVGRDLIVAAEIRATISQLEKYNSAVNTFRTKYNGIPGDLNAAAASNFGMNSIGYLLAGNEGQGDGNSIIEDGSCGNALGGPNLNKFCGEIPTFWAQLTFANLIEGSYGAHNVGLPGIPFPAATASTMSQYMPPAKLGKGMYISIASGSGINWYIMMPFQSIAAFTAVYSLNTTGISPTVAQNIDNKLDDGLPNGGVVRAVGLTVPAAPGTSNGSGADSIDTPYGMTYPSAAAAAAANKCTIWANGASIGATDTYNIATATAGANDPSCAMMFKMQ